MSTITELWIKSRETFEGKTLSQILSFAGDGKLRDDNKTSKEFRDFLAQIPSQLIKQFAEGCLSTKLEDGGFALQDIINQIGVRLGFSVTNGLYRGKRNDIGYDGIWTSREKYSIVLEVKTTDTYRINLDTIADYRLKLVEKGIINKTNSSILIVVGREDTGDLEAQIRGSRHAWDIRLLSTDSLLKILQLKEQLNDTKTIQQINELLKPKEYTRIDSLIDLIFLTSKDILLDEIEEEITVNRKEKRDTKEIYKDKPVSFYDDCVVRIQKHLRLNLIKQSRIAYTSQDNSVGVLCSISKVYSQGKSLSFWFTFRPHHNEFLNEIPSSYVAFGCGSPKNIFLIPYKDFFPLVKNMHTTEKEDSMYWHVTIQQKGDLFFLDQPKRKRSDSFDISKYRL